MRMRFPLFDEAGQQGGQGGGGGGNLLQGQQGQQGGQQGQQSSGGDPWAIADPKTGAFAQGWTDRLPEELKPAAADFQKYPDLPTFLKSAWSAKQLVGKKAEGVRVPGEGATAEEISVFRKAIGIPEKPEDYGLKKPDQLPEGVQWHEEKVAELAKLAHEHNITPKALKALMEWNVASNAKGFAEGKTKREAEAKAKMDGEKKKLAEAWGHEAQAKANLATRAAITVGLDPKSELFNSADFVMALARVGELISEDKLVSSGAVTQLQDKRAQAMDVMKNPSNPNYRRYHDGDREIVAMVRGLLGGPG